MPDSCCPPRCRWIHIDEVSTHPPLAHLQETGEVKDMGVHAFFVQLRDMNTHKPLPGITIGDIGPKLGFNSIDNGFARFDHIIIPRDHMLGGVAQVR